MSRESPESRSIMVNLSFTLSEDGVGGFRDALICLNKFSDDVSLEAREDLVRRVLQGCTRMSRLADTGSMA